MAILNTLPVAFTIALEPADISRNQQGMAQTRQPTAPSKDPCPQNLLLPYDNILTTPHLHQLLPCMVSSNRRTHRRAD